MTDTTDRTPDHLDPVLLDIDDPNGVLVEAARHIIEHSLAANAGGELSAVLYGTTISALSFGIVLGQVAIAEGAQDWIRFVLIQLGTPAEMIERGYRDARQFLLDHPIEPQTNTNLTQ